MVSQQEPVVTGDAVVLDVEIAQLPVRALSAIIDVTVVFILYITGVVLWATTLTQFDPAFSAAVLIIFTVLTIVGYPAIFETTTRGRSLGKLAMGLRVVSDDGSPERFRQALFRALAGVIEIWMLTGGPAVICSLASSKGKRIGDIFAGTVVISERAPRMSPPPLMPPQLAWWASTLQLSGLHPEQAELARQFLSRVSQLIHSCAIRWPTGSPVTSSPRYRRHRRPVPHRSTCWPQCWPNATAANSRGCSPRLLGLRHNGRQAHPRRRVPGSAAAGSAAAGSATVVRPGRFRAAELATTRCR